jgi:hypothetical protein
MCNACIKETDWTQTHMLHTKMIHSPNTLVLLPSTLPLLYLNWMELKICQAWLFGLAFWTVWNGYEEYYQHSQC